MYLYLYIIKLLYNSTDYAVAIADDAVTTEPIAVTTEPIEVANYGASLIQDLVFDIAYRA